MPLTTFGTVREERVFESKFKKTLFLDMTNTSTVRILTNGYLPVLTHWINKATVECLGDSCPVCATNKMLIMQFPETFREEPKYSPRRTVNLVNVLDKTLGRTCPKCGTDNHSVASQTSTVCKCGEILTGALTSSMKIKVLSRGVTLFDQLDAINNAILDTQGEAVGLTGYDLTFVVSGTGKNKTITPIAGQITPMGPYESTDLYDLENVTMKLSASELVDLQRGVSLKDIFAARRASEKVSELANGTVPQELIDAAQSDVDALFGIPTA